MSAIAGCVKIQRGISEIVKTDSQAEDENCHQSDWQHETIAGEEGLGEYELWSAGCGFFCHLFWFTRWLKQGFVCHLREHLQFAPNRRVQHLPPCSLVSLVRNPVALFGGI